MAILNSEYSAVAYYGKILKREKTSKQEGPFSGGNWVCTNQPEISWEVRLRSESCTRVAESSRVSNMGMVVDGSKKQSLGLYSIGANQEHFSWIKDLREFDITRLDFEDAGCWQDKYPP
ncbi:hypothetical protein MKW98_030484 [Papaver atlanticum]|uniref:Uncharacterized protein n=1 Tax=Papaver atlanticum TaxID=357466 RepID=A0AAD4SIR1_9MAGN|nr:hypothetical protein MKW98_030484 [Papaver atlanticum]